ncbi:MAG: antitoxin [Sulfuricella sp.]
MPKAFRLPGDEVWVHKNEVTGVVTLTPKRNTTAGLDEMFRLIKAAPVPEDFMAERDNRTGEFREILFHHMAGHQEKELIRHSHSGKLYGFPYLRRST